MQNLGGPKPRSFLRRRAAWLLGAAVLLGVGVWALRGSPPPPPPPKPPAAKATATMESLSLTEIQEGGKRWVLEGQKADFHKERDEISISPIKVDFFGKPGEQYQVRAQEGLLNTKTRVLILKGQVELESGETLITTSIATYLPAERVIVAPEEVVMENPRIRVEGKGLRVEVPQKKLSLSQHHLTQVKGGTWKPTP